jgi:hypothetical protein
MRSMYCCVGGNPPLLKIRQTKVCNNYIFGFDRRYRSKIKSKSTSAVPRG